MLLEELFRTEPEQIRRMVGQLRLTAAQLGLPFGERTRTYNSRLAQELGLWAEEMGCADTFHMAAFKAYFAEGLNLAEPEVLLDLAASCGLSTEAAAEVLRSRSHAPAVDADWQASRAKQVAAVPTFILKGSTLVGAQSYQTLQGLMLQHGIRRR